MRAGQHEKHASQRGPSVCIRVLGLRVTLTIMKLSIVLIENCLEKKIAYYLYTRKESPQENDEKE